MPETLDQARLDANLWDVVRKDLRREWSYFYDSLIKVLFGKSDDFDVITAGKMVEKDDLILIF